MVRLRQQASHRAPPFRRVFLVVLARQMPVTAALSCTAALKLFLRRLVVLRVGQVGRHIPSPLGTRVTLRKYSPTSMRVATRLLPATLAQPAPVHGICSATKALMAVHSQPGQRRRMARPARPSRDRESPALPAMLTSFSLVHTEVTLSRNIAIVWFKK